jgi:hypothetical protein
MSPERRPIDRAFFREFCDGTTVFFPWGLTRRGYRLASETAKKKASRAASFLVSSAIAIGTWAAYALQPILDSEGTGLPEVLGSFMAPGSALVLVCASYSLWVSRFVERFPESDLRVSREERLREASKLVEPWKLALIGVVVCSLSALSIWLQPRTWWLGLLGLAIGVGAVVWSSLLKRAADSSD